MKIKRLTAMLIALLMAIPAITAAAEVDLNLQWPEVWNEGTPTFWWPREASNKEKADTLKAIEKEYNDQLASGYRLGNLYKFNSWGNILIAEFQNGDTDNTETRGDTKTAFGVRLWRPMREWPFPLGQTLPRPLPIHPTRLATSLPLSTL